MKNEKNGKLQVPYLLLMLIKASVSSNVQSECLNYQVISDETRSVNSFWDALKCDDRLATGWYRFMDKAGSQLPEQPIMDPNRSPYRCSTQGLSWITEPHPHFWEGKVARTVCFSHGGSKCYWSTVQILVINCGSYFVYYLQRIPSCNYRFCGNTTIHERGQKTKVSCHENFMEIQLNRNFFNVSKYESITLKDKSCTARVNFPYITLGSKLNSCGTTRRETTSQIIYTNEAIMVVRRDSGIVTRDHDQVISFSCAYKKDGYTNQASFTPVSRITGNDTSIGAFTFELEMHKDQLFGGPYTSYPVNVNLNDKLYFQVKASVEDNALVLLIDKCYSTPIMDRNDYRKYTFIENGCPTDNTVQFQSADRQKQRFSIQAFRYLSNFTTTYIHCLVLVCQSSSRDSRCVSGCSGNNVHRARREISETSTMKNGGRSYSDYYTLDEGPIKLGDKQESTDESSSHAPPKATIIGLTIAVALLAVAVVVLIIKMKCKKNSKANSRKEIGIDNFANGVALVGK